MQHTHDLLKILETLIDAWLTMHRFPSACHQLAHAAILIFETFLS